MSFLQVLHIVVVLRVAAVFDVVRVATGLLLRPSAVPVVAAAAAAARRTLLVSPRPPGTGWGPNITS